MKLAFGSQGIVDRFRRQGKVQFMEGQTNGTTELRKNRHRKLLMT